MPSFKDLSNKKFDFLTVQRLVPTQENPKIRWGRLWECLCKCGNTTIARGQDLTSGHKTSCGCKTKYNLIGQRFSELLVLKVLSEENKKSKRKWWCLCNCGKLTIVSTNRLVSGTTKSCGCLRSKHKLKIGSTDHPLYCLLKAIKDRCEDKSNKNYGGRGIKVCEEWLLSEGKGFGNFYTWALENGYEKGLTIERKDVDGPYSPENCEWIPRKDQAYNKRNTVKISYKGEVQSLAKLLKVLNLKLSLQTATYWARKGKTLEFLLERFNVSV